jgi:hypothetical protein
MYGYANEILPYIMGLLQDNNTNLSNTTNSVAPAEEDAVQLSKTGKRTAPRGNAQPRPQRPQGLLGSSAPVPPRRPAMPMQPPSPMNNLAGPVAYDPNHPAMRSNSPQDNLPKGPLNLTAGPSPYGSGSSIMNPFFAQYLYGNG